MYHVRVRRNVGRGTRWWAESDDGFVGGADSLAELVGSIREWAVAEGKLGQLAVQLPADAREEIDESGLRALLQEPPDE